MHVVPPGPLHVPVIKLNFALRVNHHKCLPTSLQAKAEIRRILPLGLKETLSKVRSSVAYAVSAIAHWDWPEVWPELFPILMEALTSREPTTVHGAMRVLTGKGLFTIR